MKGLLVMKQYPFPSRKPVFSPFGTDSPCTGSKNCLSLPCRHSNTLFRLNKFAKFRIMCRHGDRELDHGPANQESHEKEMITIETQVQGTLVEFEDSGFGHEQNQLRWRFISKVYGVVVAQVAFCTTVSTAFIVSSALKAFFCGIHPAIASCAGLAPFLLMWPMIKYRKCKPLNFVILAIFTMCTSLALGLGCAFLSEIVVNQALLTTAVAVLPITGYALWGSVSGQDFGYPVPFSFSCSAVLMMVIVQLFYPLVSAPGTLLAGLLGVVFAGFLVYDIDDLIKRHPEKDYIEAAICLYRDIIHVFHCTFHVLRLIVEFHCWFFGLTD